MGVVDLVQEIKQIDIVVVKVTLGELNSESVQLRAEDKTYSVGEVITLTKIDK